LLAIIPSKLKQWKVSKR